MPRSELRLCEPDQLQSWPDQHQRRRPDRLLSAAHPTAGIFNIDASATYIRRYDYQLEPGGPFFSNVGTYGSGVGTGAGGVVFRWQTTVAANWTRGPFGVGIVNRYKTGYEDQNAQNEGHHVASYTVFDLYGSWQPVKSIPARRRHSQPVRSRPASVQSNGYVPGGL